MDRMRGLACQRGLNPDIWLGNVEVVVAEEIGQQPVAYVRNIFKYYAAYKLEEEARARRDKVLGGKE